MQETSSGYEGHLGRRAVIKRAAAAGAVAWTAPLIVDSFASPAAAVTAPKGCYKIHVDTSGVVTNWDASCVSDACDTCTDAFDLNLQLSDFCITVTGLPNQQVVTFSIGAGCSCYFTSISGKQPGAAATDPENCFAGSLLDSKTAEITKVENSKKWNEFHLCVTCG